MPLASDEEHVNVVRLVRGDRGRVRMHCEFVLRFGYGSTAPWLQREDFGAHAVAGPDAVELHTPVSLVNENLRTSATFSVGAGAPVPFILAWRTSHRPVKRRTDPRSEQRRVGKECVSTSRSRW